MSKKKTDSWYVTLDRLTSVLKSLKVPFFVTGQTLDRVTSSEDSKAVRRPKSYENSVGILRENINQEIVDSIMYMFGKYEFIQGDEFYGRPNKVFPSEGRYTVYNTSIKNAEPVHIDIISPILINGSLFKYRSNKDIFIYDNSLFEGDLVSTVYDGREFPVLKNHVLFNSLSEGKPYSLKGMTLKKTKRHWVATSFDAVMVIGADNVGKTSLMESKYPDQEIQHGVTNATYPEVGFKGVYDRFIPLDFPINILAKSKDRDRVLDKLLISRRLDVIPHFKECMELFKAQLGDSQLGLVTLLEKVGDNKDEGVYARFNEEYRNEITLYYKLLTQYLVSNFTNVTPLLPHKDLPVVSQHNTNDNIKYTYNDTDNIGVTRHIN